MAKLNQGIVNIIGNNIKRIREEKKISRNELAEKIHITVQAISQYENCKRLPNDDILNKIAAALDISINELTKETLSYRILSATIETTIGDEIEDKLFLISKKYNIPISILENVYNRNLELALHEQEILLENLPHNYPQYTDLKIALVLEYNKQNPKPFHEMLEEANSIFQKIDTNPKIISFNSFLSMLESYKIELPSEMSLQQIKKIEQTAIPYIKFLVSEAIKEMPEYIERLTDKKEGD